jgi:hypothetical protein
LIFNNPHTTQQSELIYSRKNNIDFEFDVISGVSSKEIKWKRDYFVPANSVHPK